MLHYDLVNFNFTLTVVRRRGFFFPHTSFKSNFCCSFHPNRKILLPFFIYGYLDTSCLTRWLLKFIDKIQPLCLVVFLQMVIKNSCLQQMKLVSLLIVTQE